MAKRYATDEKVAMVLATLVMGLATEIFAKGRRFLSAFSLK